MTSHLFFFFAVEIKQREEIGPRAGLVGLDSGIECETDAADAGGSHRDHGEGALLLVLQVADHGHTLEFREEIGNPVGASLGHGEEKTRHVDGLVNDGIARSVEAMVILGAQVEDEEPAAVASGGVLKGDTDEVGQGVLVTLDLNHHAAHNFTTAQQLAVSGGCQESSGVRRTSIRNQAAGEELLEARVLRDRLLDLGDVDAVHADHHLDHFLVNEAGNVMGRGELAEPAGDCVRGRVGDGLHQSAGDRGATLREGTGDDIGDGENGCDDIMVEGLEGFLGGEALAAAADDTLGEIRGVHVLAAEFGEGSTGAEALGDGGEVVDGLIRAHHSKGAEGFECSGAAGTEGLAI